MSIPENRTPVVSLVTPGLTGWTGVILRGAGKKATPAEVVEHLNRGLTAGSTPTSLGGTDG